MSGACVLVGMCTGCVKACVHTIVTPVFLISARIQTTLFPPPPSPLLTFLLCASKPDMIIPYFFRLQSACSSSNKELKAQYSITSVS